MDDESNDIKYFIKSRLDNYDKSNKKYYNLINNDDIKIDYQDGHIYIKFFENEKTVYEGRTTILGTMDLESKVWLWSWVTPNFTIEETKDARDILNYGLALEPNSNSTIHFYIKSHFVNSRIYFNADITLDIHLALSLYITKKGKFIYPRFKNISGKKVIVYYLVY